MYAGRLRSTSSARGPQPPKVSSLKRTCVWTNSLGLCVVKVHFLFCTMFRGYCLFCVTSVLNSCVTFRIFERLLCFERQRNFAFERQFSALDQSDLRDKNIFSLCDNAKTCLICITNYLLFWCANSWDHCLPRGRAICILIRLPDHLLIIFTIRLVGMVLLTALRSCAFRFACTLGADVRLG